MSLLTNFVRSMLAAPRPPVVTPRDAGAQADAWASAPAPAPAPAVAAATDTPPAWRLLADQAGVQDHDYPEGTRGAIRELFGHQPKRVLDVGCASGAVGAGLKQAIPGVWVWGCELNPRAARLAATRLDHVTPVARTDWGAEDVALLASVDTVLLLDVLEHMVNPWGELEYLAQHLPRDAQVIVSLPNIGHISVLQDLARGTFQYHRMGILDVTHLRFFTLEGMLSMFAETGFDVEAVAVLSSSGLKANAFPTQIQSGKLQLLVETEEEWQRLNAIQFGFRLRPRPAPL